MAEILDVKEVFRHYKDKIYRLAISIVRNEKDAEDCLQNTVLKIMKYGDRFRHESRVSTWVYRIAYNEALMLLRKRSSQYKAFGRMTHDARRVPSGFIVNWEKLPGKALLEREFKDRIENGIKSLPIQYRMPLLLHAIEDLSVKETAEILGITEASVKTRLHRAYRLIQGEREAYFKDKVLEHRKKPLHCGRWTSFLSALNTGKVSEGEKSAFDRHIDDCPGCKSFIGSYRKAITITKALECQDLPLQLQEKIESFLLKQKIT